MASKYTKVLHKYILFTSIAFAMLFSSQRLFSQIDTDFWFVVPELSHRGGTAGTPGTLRIATLELEATVVISMPANTYNATTNPTGFQDIVLNIAANSTAAVDLSNLIDIAALPFINRLENKPLTGSGINNFGLHITATNMITAYWEIDFDFGSDLWTLKGKNALGTLFYTPFQTSYPNRTYTPPTYSAIDIVASKDATQVTITLPAGIAASFGSGVTTIPAGGTYVVNLNRGQTFSLFPFQYSILANERLAGTKIESNEPIAVTLKDDAIRTGPQSEDLIGDQMIPVDILGDNYIIPEIKIPNQAYVIATEDNTDIYVYDPAGAPIGPTPYMTLNAGQQGVINVPGGSKFAQITSQDTDKPFYVFHLATENASRGAALVPSIGCTGNTQLAFTRARANKFYFFIVTKKGNEDKFLVDGVRNDGVIDPGAFTDIAGSGGWVALTTNSLSDNTLAVGQHLITNTGGIFHLAIVNGRPAAHGRLYYGYYSDFGGLNIGASVAGTNSDVVRACFGDPVQLYAFGGTTYKWTPDAYLDDGNINLPTAINLPPGPHKYTVDVSGGGCGSGQIDLNVLVSAPIVAHFETNVTSGCSPLEIQFDDLSTGVFEWKYYFEDDTILYDDDPVTSVPQPPNFPNPFGFTKTYTNFTDSAVKHTITLLVKNSNGCSDILTKTIVVFPEIQSGFTTGGGIDSGCDPLEVSFQNTSTGNTDRWVWEFGDGGSTVVRDPVHTFRNLFGPGNKVFNTQLIAISPFLCRDTTILPITVSPYIEAKFAYDTVAACSPHDIILTDQSIGADSYTWDFGDLTGSNSSGPVITKLYNNLTADPVTYNIKLRVDNNEGCFDTISRNVTIYPEVTAAFTPIPLEACSPSEIAFQNNSTGAAFYLWDFGDGGSSTEVNPIHYFDRNILDHDTTFVVKLIATSTELCRDTVTFDVVIHPYIEAAYTIPDIVGCHPFTVSINNESFGVNTYKWTYGDGTPVDNSSGALITHTYNNLTDFTQYYTLELVVLNDEGCSDTLKRIITVHPEITAGFQPDFLEGCHPLTVTFTDLSVKVDPSNYLWDFGDGAASVEQSPVHTFTNFGNADSTYLVTLTTSTSDGECVKQASWPMVIHPQVDVEFTFSEALNCTPFEVTFENLTIGGTDYTWDFGDGTVVNVLDTLPQVHTFTNADFSAIQNYNVSLVANNVEGCSDEVIKKVSVYPDIQTAMTASITSGCQPLTVDFTNQTDGGSLYIWDFGDGSTSNQFEPSHTFVNTGSSDTTFRVKLLSIAGNNFCEDSSFVDITVFPYIKAKFSLPEDLGCNPFDVVIENSSVNGTQFNWDFGDGTSTVLLNSNTFTHTYFNADFNNPQDYEITLVAENAFGCSSEIRRTVTVEPDIQAGFLSDVTEGCHPLTVQFTESSDGEAYYQWDFGNGTTSPAANPTQVFTNIGSKDTIYQVWLVVTAPNNECKDSISIDITVHPFIKADLTFQDNINCHPSTVQIVNSSVGGSVFDWDFGDGLTATTINMDPVSHVFSNTSFSSIATYQVTLTAQNSAGCTSIASKTIEVYPDIQSAFTASDFEGCHPLNVNFTNISQGGFTYTWDFDNGSSSDETAPSYTFNNFTGAPITRNVELVAASQFNCTDTFTANITIHPTPVARFETDRLIDCPPYDIEMTNTSLNADIYTWDFGDGSPVNNSTSNVITHTYDNDEPDVVTNILSLTATSNFGCVDATQQEVYVYPKTIADFTMNDEGCSPLVVNFTNLSVRGNIYLWDFGDGKNLSVTDPTNIYFNTTGDDITYDVSLTSISNYGCVNTMVDTIFVFAQPDVEFTATPTHQNYPDATVTYTNLTPDGIWDYTWALGDGIGSFVEDPPAHTYSTWGEYIITLTAETDHCSDEISHSVRIFPAPPVAGVDTVFPGCEPLEVQFINNTIYGSDYLWEFDDGTTSTEFEPFHTFQSAGLYNVKLTVTGEGGIDYHYKEIEVFKMPELDFKVVPDEIMLPNQAARFFNLTHYADYYLWDFGDGSTSADVSPSYLYSEVGLYEVTLEAWTYDGCYDKLVKTAAINVKGEGDIVYPTAFKPDMTGPNGGHFDIMSPERNNIFHPHWEGVREYKLEIYNRWGQKMFESRDVNIGWDGYFRGVLCEQGVYVWQVTGTYSNGEPFKEAGDVTLLHHEND